MNFDLVQIQREYIKKMLGVTQALKCLIIDKRISQIISMVFTQFEGFEQDVYLIETIENMNQEPLPFAAGIFILASP